jgi:hypothetical protein
MHKCNVKCTLACTLWNVRLFAGLCMGCAVGSVSILTLLGQQMLGNMLRILPL